MPLCSKTPEAATSATKCRIDEISMREEVRQQLTSVRPGEASLVATSRPSGDRDANAVPAAAQIIRMLARCRIVDEGAMGYSDDTSGNTDFKLRSACQRTCRTLRDCRTIRRGPIEQSFELILSRS
jgi:hypothetical protein